MTSFMRFHGRQRHARGNGDQQLIGCNGQVHEHLSEHLGFDRKHHHPGSGQCLSVVRTDAHAKLGNSAEAKAKLEKDALAGLERWKKKHPEVAELLAAG